MNSAIELKTANTPATEWIDREWIVTNGLGGYASGTVLGDITRRYHGLFVPNLASPKGRHLMISRAVDEFIAGNAQTTFGDKPRRRDVDNRHSALQAFMLNGNVAKWVFQVGEAVIEKEVVMPHSYNTVCVRYTLAAGKAVTLRWRPYFAFRRHDADLNTAGFGRFRTVISDTRYEIALEESPLVLRVHAISDGCRFVAEESELEHLLTRERRRGNACDEHAHSCGYWETNLQSGQRLSLIVSTHQWDRLNFDVDSAFEAEIRRTATFTNKRRSQTRLSRRLTVAADQFLILPASRGEDVVMAAAEGHDLRTVIAGYHWFGDWGRDTMISLEGLMLCTRRHREARATLQTFAGYVVDGLLPNLFPEGEREGIYNTVDATLWYFHALHRYLQATNDMELLEELRPILADIIRHHIRGTRFGIHMADDGLISAAADGYQLTWMDAKVDGWVVTPRRGKPVEIQALWYNALRLMSEWSTGRSHKTQYSQLADKVRASFNDRFVRTDAAALFDVIDGPYGNDPAFRPNQIFAISLDHPVLDRAHWPALIDSVRSQLLTPFGLRTLSREHPDYKSAYDGDLRARDAAYHQGTVWPWLIGHFIDAWLKVYSDRNEARKFLDAFDAHLFEAGIGTISEIFDGEPPHAPHGCIAQAWSVAEVLRALHVIETSTDHPNRTP